MQHNLFQWTSDLWLTLDQWGILIGLVTGIVNLLAIVLAVVKRESLRRWFIRNRFPNVGEATADQQRDALVFTVSHSEVPQWIIENSQPRCIGLIASKQSYESAKKIDKFARARGIEVLPVSEIENADNPLETMENCLFLIKLMQKKGLANIAIDITGGKVPMSLGAFMAAEEMQVDTLYVSTRYDTQLKQPDMRSAKAIIISRPE